MAQSLLPHWRLCNVRNHVPTGMLPAQPLVNKRCPQIMPLESDVLPARRRMHPSRPRWPQPQDATGPWRIRSFGVTTPSLHHALKTSWFSEAICLRAPRLTQKHCRGRPHLCPNKVAPKHGSIDKATVHQHQWSSGRIHCCHRCDPGSIPG